MGEQVQQTQHNMHDNDIGKHNAKPVARILHTSKL